MRSEDLSTYNDDIRSFLSDWTSDNEVPGLSAVVVTADDVVYADGFGARELSTNDPATPRTLFGIGSCSKSVTALGILQLVEDGELSLSDEVSSFVPHLDEAPDEPVTVEELLSHSSGLPSDGYLTALIRRLCGMGEMGVPLSDDEDFLQHVRGAVDDRRDAADQFFYYNTGYVLLGKVIEAVTGQSYSEYVRDNVFDPLGMDRTCFSRSAFESYDDRMQAYYREDDEIVEGDLPFDELLYAPGGIVSCADDLANYLRMYLNDGELDGERIVAPDSVSTMYEPRSTRSSFIDGREREYALGWEVQTFLGNRMVRHGGMMGTTTAALAFFPEEGVGVAVACNTAPSQHPSVASQGMLAILEGEDPDEVVPALKLADKLETLEGEYESYRGIRQASVERSGGNLEVTVEGFTSDFSFTLYPKHVLGEETVFETVSDTAKRVPVEFEVGPDGDVSMFMRRWRYEKQR
jgi:CubicO group peptidase (beta-lactamase class C family)